MFKLKLLSLLSLTITTSTALTALDDYIRKAEPKFSWRDTGRRVEKLPFGSTAVELNVTSLEWLDVTKAIGPNGALWTHQVMVVLPETLKITNITTMVMTGGLLVVDLEEQFPEHNQLLRANMQYVVAVSLFLKQLIRFPNEVGEDFAVSCWLSIVGVVVKSE